MGSVKVTISAENVDLLRPLKEQRGFATWQETVDYALPRGCKRLSALDKYNEKKAKEQRAEERASGKKAKKRKAKKAKSLEEVVITSEPKKRSKKAAKKPGKKVKRPPIVEANGADTTDTVTVEEETVEAVG